MFNLRNLRQCPAGGFSFLGVMIRRVVCNRRPACVSPPPEKGRVRDQATSAEGPNLFASANTFPLSGKRQEKSSHISSRSRDAMQNAPSVSDLKQPIPLMPEQRPDRWRRRTRNNRRESQSRAAPVQCASIAKASRTLNRAAVNCWIFSRCRP